MISTLFTSILAIWLLILSTRVIALRGASFLKFFAFNNFGEKALSRSVRAQGNFIEYTPFFLILLFIAHIILNEKKIVLKFSLIAPLIFLISLIRPHFAFFVLKEDSTLIIHHQSVLPQNDDNHF